MANKVVKRIGISFIRSLNAVDFYAYTIYVNRTFLFGCRIDSFILMKIEAFFVLVLEYSSIVDVEGAESWNYYRGSGDI